METRAYFNKVFSWLWNAKTGYYEVAKLAKSETTELFIAAIQEAIDLRLGWNEGWYLEFNDDFTMFAKKSLYETQWKKKSLK